MLLQSRAIVVTGGVPLSPLTVTALPHDALFIAADSGLDHALAAGLQPSVLVGDCDSISTAGLAWANTHNLEMQLFAPEKDFTDTELGLQAAVASGATEIILVGGGGDRLDHTIGAITALGHPSLSGCSSLAAYWGLSFVRVLHGPASAEFTLRAGATFSLLTLHGACTGVGLIGARYPLERETLEPGASRGISNEIDAAALSVSVESGVLTIIFPDHFSFTNGAPQ